MWQVSDFRPTHSTPIVVPKKCFVVLCVPSVVKLAAYRWWGKISEFFWAIRDQLIFCPHLGPF